ncbi:chorismate mutase [Pseudomonas hunanensis]|uniref:Chorismate mutase n=1 Tax=Pseudomonas hunanensis TaxID=1247546 RepID=A0ACC6K2J3_9PSED|nr:chorismate mutase [Pseudomonas hunanensis]MDR6712607.1 chorismate mutase [Pseudomonas hunanensis]
MRLAPLVLFCVFGLNGCAAAPTDPTLLHLLNLIERRLATADVVALHKWDSQQPVQATEREHSIVAAVRLAAPAYQLSPDLAATFFDDQIEANKLIQYTLLSQWHLVGQAPDLPRHDLQKTIRPRLDSLQADLLRQLAYFHQQRPQDCASQLAFALAQRKGDAIHRVGMIRATGQLCD